MKFSVTYTFWKILYTARVKEILQCRLSLSKMWTRFNNVIHFLSSKPGQVLHLSEADI